jgi:TPR repeat protein
MGTADKDSNDLVSGIRAFQKGLYTEAHDKLLEPAEQGDLRAQMIMSRLYYAGNGVEKDHEKYVYWLQMAADSGDKASKSQLKRLKKKEQ